MLFMKITSRQNTLIKETTKLSQSKKFRDKTHLMVLDGIHLCEEFSKQQGTFKYLFVTSRFKQNPEFKKFSNIENILEIEENLMQKISTSKTPVGILGVVEKPITQEIKSTLSENFILLLENIQDPGNLGTIFRTAVAAGIEAIFCDKNCSDVFSPKVLRASMGANFYTKIFENVDLEKIPSSFDGDIIGTILSDSSESIFKTKFNTRTAFLFGNEGNGISDSLEKICTKKIVIPMQNNFESLNVAIAVGICLFEKVRQKN